MTPMLLRYVALAAAALRAAAKDLDRCEACVVTSRALAEVLALEHLDEDKTDILAGGRLDSKGVRQGEVIKYATSEFRTSHILDQVCDRAATFVPRFGSWWQNGTLARRFEERLKGATKEPMPKISKVNNANDELKLALRTYCDNLVEEHEDDLAALIKGDGVDDADRRSTVCTSLAKSCKTGEAIDAALGRVADAEAKAAAKDAAKVEAGDGDAAPKKKRKRKKKAAAKDL